MKYLVLVLLLSVPALAVASKKPDPREGRQDEAKSECFSYLKANSKDPDTFEVKQDTASWEPGHGIFGKYDIWVTVEGRAKNTYGAVLEHSFTCEVQCKKDVPCHVVTVQDDPR